MPSQCFNNESSRFAFGILLFSLFLHRSLSALKLGLQLEYTVKTPFCKHEFMICTFVSKPLLEDCFQWNQAANIALCFNRTKMYAGIKWGILKVPPAWWITSACSWIMWLSFPFLLRRVDRDLTVELIADGNSLCKFAEFTYCLILCNIELGWRLHFVLLGLNQQIVLLSLHQQMFSCVRW